MSRTFLVTGATSGIGKAFSTLARQNDVRVVALARGECSNADEVITADFRYPDTVFSTVAGVQIEFDGYVNCAGVLPGHNYAETNAEELAELFAVNVISPMMVIKALSPKLVKGSSILLMGSVSGQKGSYDDGYASSKAAIHGLVRSLAPKLAPRVRVVGVAPAVTLPSRMTSEMVPGRLETVQQMLPMQSVGSAQDLADIMWFLMSPSCKFMTGCTVDVNGGQYLR